MPITESAVARAQDRGNVDLIKAFQDSGDSSFIQAMALVDAEGNQIAVNGNPLYIAITGDSSVSISGSIFLDSTTIEQLTGSLISVSISGTPTIILNNSSIDSLTGSNIRINGDVSASGTVSLEAETIDSITSSISTISINGDSIAALTSATSVTESILIGGSGEKIGLSSSPVWTSITGNKESAIVNDVGKLDVAQSDTYGIFNDILKELKKINLQLAIMTDMSITNIDVEV